MKDLTHVPCGKKTIWEISTLGLRCMFCGVSIRDDNEYMYKKPRTGETKTNGKKV